MAAANQRFDGPRSPPNTSHVPCKFFRQGACQAGNACPFSHDLSMAAENVCKYFAKGNCKFGPKCANIHVLPDGRRINYGKNGVTVAPTPTINLGSRVNPNTYHQSSNSALTNSFMRGVEAPIPLYGAPNPYMPVDDRYAQHHLGHQPSLENGLPTIDTTYSSNPASAYGSPRDDEAANRFGLGLSPGNPKGLSVLDAPLPASFDSQGISLAARYGPWPSSVPSKFGLESPSASLNAAKDARTSETLKLLHTSAFGSNDRLSSSTLAANEVGFFGSVGSGLPTGSSPPVNLGEEYFGKRTMHSQRFAKPRMLSASAPKVDRDWEAEFVFLEEDYVPSALANDVLTPQEKARRGSVRLDEPATGGGSEATSSSLPKFGSLGTSPSRWGALFQRQRSEEDSGSAEPGLIPGKSMKYATSAFGHVGSPLRNSSLAIDVEMNGGLSSLGNGASQTRRAGNEPFSALTQQLQHTSLGENSDAVGNGSSPRLHPNSARTTGGLGYAAPSGLATALKQERDGGREHRGMERHVSSGSIGSGRFTTPIDEEDPAFVFNMEEDDPSSGQGQQQQQQNQQSQAQRARKRVSGGLGVTGWSYAGVAAGARSSAVNGSKPREVPGAVEAVGGR